MMLRRAPDTSRRDSDSGLSLTELAVTMLVMSVVVIATVTLIIGFQRSNAQNELRQQQIDAGRFASEVMTKNIRTAIRQVQVAATCTGPSCDDAFLLGADNAVHFYANINNSANAVGPSKVTYSVSTSGPTAGQLVETVQRPDSNVAGANGYAYCNAQAPGATALCKSRFSSRVLAEGVQASGSQPLFTFFDADGNALDPSTSGGTFDGDDLSRVLAIELAIQVQQPGNHRAETTTYIQRVSLPNTQAVIRQEESTP